MTKTIASIKSLKTNPDSFGSHVLSEVEYFVAHTDRSTTIDQSLLLSHGPEGWVASMAMDDFPPQHSAQEAAIKLATWMEKMAEAIKGGDFTKIDIGKL